jgi:hypothetical protein
MGRPKKFERKDVFFLCIDDVICGSRPSQYSLWANGSYVFSNTVIPRLETLLVPFKIMPSIRRLRNALVHVYCCLRLVSSRKTPILYPDINKLPAISCVPGSISHKLYCTLSRCITIESIKTYKNTVNFLVVMYS